MKPSRIARSSPWIVPVNAIEKKNNPVETFNVNLPLRLSCARLLRLTNPMPTAYPTLLAHAQRVDRAELANLP
jgi:hypothetical protein